MKTVRNITVTDGRAKTSIETGVTNLIADKVTNQINQAIENERPTTGVITKFYPYLDKAEVKMDKTNERVLCKILHRHGGELLDFYTPFGDQTLCDKLKEPCVIPRDTMHCLVMNISDFDSEEHIILGFYLNEEIIGLDPAKPGNMKLITRGGINHHWVSFGYCGLDVRTTNKSTFETGHQTDEIVQVDYADYDDVYTKEEVDDLISGGGDLSDYVKKSDVQFCVSLEDNGTMIFGLDIGDGY